jgi:hypothetical protein
MIAARTAAILMIALGAGPCMAQSNPVPQPGSRTPATNPAAGPGEPDIIMPQVVLQVEDLSVEKVQAQLPPEEEMLAPTRPIPALTEGELAVGEPTIPAAAVETEGSAAPSSTRLLSSEVQVGTGTQNMILGGVSLKTLGPDPRFSVQFRHETLDGFSGNDPGSGFNLRNDSLDGGLKFRLGGISADLAGSFKEDDNGLQGLGGPGGIYSSDLTRAISGMASFSGDPADWVTVSLSAAGGLDTMTLQGAAPESAGGLRISPSLSALAHFGAFKAGLETRYWYRDESFLFNGTDQLHRLKIAAILSLELPAMFVIEARGGWFYNSAELSRFPFSLSVTGTPLEFLTLSLEGGYRVVPYDMHDVLSAGAFVLPDLLEDDRGWYADASVKLSLMRELSASVKATYMAHEAMPSGSFIPDPVTGLFPVTQASATQLSASAGLRWGITQAFSLSAELNRELLDRPFFTPVYAIKAGIVGLDSSGRFGGSFTVAVGPIADGTLQQPVLHLSGFWKIIDAVKLQVEGDDLLAPLSGRDRWSVARDLFITPGFRIIGSLSMSL